MSVMFRNVYHPELSVTLSYPGLQRARVELTHLFLVAVLKAEAENASPFGPERLVSPLRDWLGVPEVEEPDHEMDEYEVDAYADVRALAALDLTSNETLAHTLLPLNCHRLDYVMVDGHLHQMLETWGIGNRVEGELLQAFAGLTKFVDHADDRGSWTEGDVLDIATLFRVISRYLPPEQWTLVTQSCLTTSLPELARLFLQKERQRGPIALV